MVGLVRKVVISSKLTEARKAEEALLGEVRRCGYSDSAVFAIKLALEEGLNNAIKHGNAYDPDKMVELEFDVTPQQASITITDQGQGFDPDSIPDPTVDENLERPCGRGIMLMRAYMDKVEYSGRGNRVRLLKHNR
ncbi:MAG: ATP-binding protein [Phycisphaerae bacterium]